MRRLSFVTALGLLLSFFSCRTEALKEQQKMASNLNFSKHWSKVNGGSNSDHFWSGTGTSDGGYIAVGYTASTDGDISGMKGQTDALVVKYDASGNKIWQVLIGGAGQDYAT